MDLTYSEQFKDYIQEQDNVLQQIFDLKELG